MIGRWMVFLWPLSLSSCIYSSIFFLHFLLFLWRFYFHLNVHSYLVLPILFRQLWQTPHFIVNQTTSRDIASFSLSFSCPTHNSSTALDRTWKITWHPHWAVARLPLEVFLHRRGGVCVIFSPWYFPLRRSIGASWVRLIPPSPCSGGRSLS